LLRYQEKAIVEVIFFIMNKKIQPGNGQLGVQCAGTAALGLKKCIAKRSI
jgi:hypothetical protein